MQVSELIEKLKKAPAGANVSVVGYRTLKEIGELETDYNDNDEVMYRIDCDIQYTSAVDDNPCDEVVLYI